MNPHWQAFIAQSEESVFNRFPGLVLLTLENEPPQLHGHIDLKDAFGNTYDQYLITIVPSNDPYTWFPAVYETGGRLPPNNDWHVFENGQCCIKSIPEQIVRCKKGLSLLQFIEEEVLPYFSAQSFREQHGYYLQERSHGEMGNLEYIFGLLKTIKPELAVKWLQFILEEKELNRSNRCFCGSRKLYRHCHMTAYRDLRLLPEHILRRYLNILIFRAL